LTQMVPPTLKKYRRHNHKRMMIKKNNQIQMNQDKKDLYHHKNDN